MSVHRLAERTCDALRQQTAGDPADPAMFADLALIDGEEIDMVVNCLEETLSVLKHAKSLIVSTLSVLKHTKSLIVSTLSVLKHAKYPVLS